MRVDEAANMLYYTARDGDNYMKLQLHRVGLDGKNDKRLTDPAFTHTITLVARRQVLHRRRARRTTGRR